MEENSFPECGANGPAQLALPSRPVFLVAVPDLKVLLV